MFTAADFIRVLEALPSDHDDHNGGQQNTFVLDRSGEKLISVSRVQRVLLDLVDSRVHVRIDELSALLDVKEVGPFLQWADQQPDLATPSNGGLSLPSWMQKTIAIHVFVAADHAFTSLTDLSGFWGLPVATLHQIIEVYSTSFYVPEDIEGQLASSRLLRAEKRRLRSLLHNANDTATPVRLSDGPHLSNVSIARRLAAKIIEIDESADYDFEERSQGLFYIPTAAIRSKADRDVQQTINKHKETLRKRGFCIIIENAATRDQTLRELNDPVPLPPSGPPMSTSFYHSFSRHALTAANHWPVDGAAVVIDTPNLKDIETLLLSGVPSIAKRIWSEGIEYDSSSPLSMPFPDQALKLLMNGYEDNDLDALYLRSTRRKVLEDALKREIDALGAKGTEDLRNLVHDKLLVTTRLYLNGFEVVHAKDHELGDRVAEHIVWYIGHDIIPALSSDVEQLQIRPPASVAKEYEKMIKELHEAKSINDVRKGLDRMKRKLKIATSEGDDRTELIQVRDELLNAKIRALPRMKRASDVMQHITWSLLSSLIDRPAMFVSSGKVATKMIKLFGSLASEQSTAHNGNASEDRFDWDATRTQLEAFRDRVKEGTSAKEDFDLTFKVARDAFEARNCRG